MAEAVKDFLLSGTRLRERMDAKLEGLRENRRRHQKYVQTFRELDRTTDRDLHEIGISRADIAQICDEAAYGRRS